MTRRKKRKLKKSVFLSLTIIFLIGIGFGIYLGKDKVIDLFSSKAVNINNNNKVNNVDEIVEDEVYKVNMLATGDGLIHNAVYYAYEEGYRGSGIYNFDGALTYIKDIVSKYDIAYYNQETPFAGGTPSGYPRFSTPS